MRGTFDWLQLLLKYVSKNSLVFVQGLNYYDKFDTPNHPLISLLNSSHCDEKWLNFLLFKILEIISFDQVKIDNATLNRAYSICINRYKKQQWADMIVEYAKKTKQNFEFKLESSDNEAAGGAPLPGGAPIPGGAPLPGVAPAPLPGTAPLPSGAPLPK